MSIYEHVSFNVAHQKLEILDLLHVEAFMSCKLPQGHAIHGLSNSREFAGPSSLDEPTKIQNGCEHIPKNRLTNSFNMFFILWMLGVPSFDAQIGAWGFSRMAKVLDGPPAASGVAHDLSGHQHPSTLKLAVGWEGVKEQARELPGVA